jgi:crossover junction endodeoxyribonuclease RuvC
MHDEPYDPRSYIFAIDPGVNGGWGVLDWHGEYVGCGDLPRFDKLLNAVELGKLVWGYAPKMAVVEKVSAMPGQGVTSMFTFGAAYGVCIGVIGGAGTPLTLVTPMSWKKHFRLVGKPKDAARELANRIFPRGAHALNLKKHGGRADALLIARYAFDMDTGAKHP